MSGTGSPSDQTGQANTDVDQGAQASATSDTSVNADGHSGDANSQDGASSAQSDRGANKDPKPTLADVVKTAAELADNGQAKSPAAANDGKEKVEGEAAAEGEKPEGEKAAETDDSKLPFHNHPRWKQVIGQNQELTREVETLKPAAEQFEKIDAFMSEHQLTHEEVGEGFIIMAMMKSGDPRGLQKLMEAHDKLALALGEKLPADLQEQVESGAITEAAAKELSLSRVKTGRLEQDATKRQEQETRQREQDAATNLANECKAATTKWETEARAKDPDFAKKEKAVARFARAIMQEKGFPKSAEAAVQIIKDAYAEVNQEFKSALPQKQPVARVPSASSQNGAKPAARNLRDVVAAAANQ